MTLTNKHRKSSKGQKAALHRKPDRPLSREDFESSKSLKAALDRKKELEQGAIRRFWAETFGIRKLDYATLEPFRVRAAWRISREVAGHCGLLARDQPFMDLAERFHEPLTAPLAPSDWPDAAIPLHPGELKNGQREAFTQRASAVSKALGIVAGSIEDRQHGRIGLEGMLSPRTLRRAWPSVGSILAFEQYMVTEALELLVDNTVIAFRKHLWRYYGLADREMDVVLSLARQEAVILTEASLDERRALMEIRLDSIICSEETGNKSRLSAMKQLASIQGLGRSEPENASRLFIDVVADFSRQVPMTTPVDREKAIPAEIRALLPDRAPEH